MSNYPRRHHYVPAFYLAGFTLQGSRNSELFVFDCGQAKSWKSTPGKTGHQRDFYSVDLGSDVHSGTFESKVLSEVDGRCSRVIRETISSRRLPEGEDFSVLLNFVALSFVRIPRTRQLVNQVTDHVLQQKVRSLISTEEGWKYFQALSENECGQLSKDDAEQFRQSILDGKYDIELDRTSQVQWIGNLVEEALPLLAERTWSVGFVADGVPDLVCSDAPFSLVPNSSFDGTDELHLANHHMVAFLPLTRRAALLGTYEERPPTFQMNECGVLSINSSTIMEARQVFSAAEDFVYQGADRKPKHMMDLKHVQERQEGKYSSLKERLDEWLQDRPIP